VVVGYGIAQHLSLGLFDMNNPFEVFVPRPGKGTIETPEEAFNKFKIAPVGIYAVSEELDSKYVFADLVLTKHCSNSNLTKFQELNASSNPAPMKPRWFPSSKHLQQQSHCQEPRATQQFVQDAQYRECRDLPHLHARHHPHPICVFGLDFMVIIDKQSNLKTLYNLGSEVKDLRRIFLLQGTLVCVLAAFWFGHRFGHCVFAATIQPRDDYAYAFIRWFSQSKM
jgi:lipoprotein-releasing system permease protein